MIRITDSLEGPYRDEQPERRKGRREVVTLSLLVVSLGLIVLSIWAAP